MENKFWISPSEDGPDILHYAIEEDYDEAIAIIEYKLREFYRYENGRKIPFIKFLHNM